MRFSTFAGLATTLLLGSSDSSHAGQSTPYAALVPVITSKMPALPNPPGTLEIPDMQPFFDYFAWQEMIALCWPSDPEGGRGRPQGPDKPGTFLSANTGKGGDAPVVWYTYPVAEELFRPQGEAPKPWTGSFKAPTLHALHAFQKPLALNPALGGDPTDFNQAFGGPLIDQHGNYTMYEEYFNKAEYDAVAANKWYLRANLKKAVGNTGITMPEGAVELKASWRPMVEGDDPTRYYTVEARVPDASGVGFKTVRLGLVGLHIAVKSSSAPQWLWATFEQVDNVTATPPVKASYNSGALPPSKRGYDYEPKQVTSLPPPSQPPVEVNRVTPILTQPPGYSTADLNKAFQAMLKGTVWSRYQLIVCQWPSAPGPTPYNPGFDPATYNPKLAGVPVPRFVANTTMETYFQGNDPDVSCECNTSNSCMQCHYHAAALGTDYAWAVFNRAYPPPPAAAAAAHPAAKTPKEK